MPAIRANGTAVEIERLVIGADYGADGYTTLAQADELRRLLDLRPADRLLELGSGRGWPGLHLAKTSGCTLVMTDVPTNDAPPPGDGLRHALRRATADGLRPRCAVIAANGKHLPFRAATFDAIVSGDVMC